MLRIFFFTILFVFTAQFAAAQDTIYRTNHEKVVAKIQEVGTYEIKYKRYAAQDGPLYVLKRSEVWKIVYPDGTVETYTEPSAGPTAVAPTRRWMIGLNAFDLVTGQITLSGEYALTDHVSFRVPVSSGVNALFQQRLDESGSPDFYYYNKNKTFSTGADILYTALRTRFVDYFIGFSGEYGQVRSRNYYYQYYYYPPVYETRTYWYIGTGLKNGFVFKPSPQLNIVVDCALGMDVNDYFGYRPMARFGITTGWRFGKEVTK